MLFQTVEYQSIKRPLCSGVDNLVFLWISFESDFYSPENQKIMAFFRLPPRLKLLTTKKEVSFLLHDFPEYF